MGRVKGKIAVVTGAAGGQGAAEARALAAEGATVIATDLSVPDLDHEGVVGRALGVTCEEAWRSIAGWLREEYGHVSSVLPGFIETPMTASAPEAFRRATIEVTPLGRLGRVEDVAPLVVFLIFDESSYITGARIAVDGGQSAHGGVGSLSDAVLSASAAQP